MIFTFFFAVLVNLSFSLVLCILVGAFPLLLSIPSSLQSSCNWPLTSLLYVLSLSNWQCQLHHMHHTPLFSFLFSNISALTLVLSLSFFFYTLRTSLLYSSSLSTLLCFFCWALLSLFLSSELFLLILYNLDCCTFRCLLVFTFSLSAVSASSHASYSFGFTSDSLSSDFVCLFPLFSSSF